MAKCLSAEVQIDLTRADLGLLIDALLQAEATLCDVGRRTVSARFIARMGAQQLALADRLEDVMRLGCSDFVTSADHVLPVSPH